MKPTTLPRRSNERDLTPRERSILQAIVQNFILDATPVGSRNLSKVLQEELHLSPASLRNTMADLEEMGYITHTHTSSGRIPTDKGYRYYVDSLMNIEPLPEQEVQAIHQHILAACQNEATLKDVSKILGSLSRHLSIIKMPQIAHATIDKIELFRLASHRLLVVLTLNSDIVRTLTLEASFELENPDCEDIARALNEKLAGKSLEFIRTNLQDIVREADIGNHALVRLFVNSADELFSDHILPGGTVHIAGAQHLFDHPEFDSPSRVRSIIELIESEEVIIHLLDSSAPKAEGMVRVAIGSEIDSSLMGEYSLLTTKYRYAPANAVGTIGLIGPKRMNYSRLIAIMHYVASALSHAEGEAL
ncbi:MAG: heat-inducible transcriptional repressor HrcA [Bacteroidota bacterium]|nr:heat-inducible transcriptional repressor HrcA [Candidatus Kapabacteria bacterium]MDW8220892.1 heat-inducible transcriptional repressor HrcA [Bacteroidota bacterium]